MQGLQPAANVLLRKQRSRDIWDAEQPYLSTGITSLVRHLPVSFERGENDILWDADGNRYIDWSGGTLTASTGHCNRHVAEAVKQQLDRLWNIHDHPSATRAEVLRRLAARMPSDDYAFQFYTTGSEAMEAAIRAAQSAVSFRRRRVASFSQGYHGKTRGSLMAVHALFGRNAQPSHIAPLSLPFPECYRCPYDRSRSSCELHCAEVHVEMLESDKSVGALVFEPVLGTGGVYGPPDGYWEKISAACKRLGILLIADEVSTGAFRTGSFLAVEQLGVEPDLIVFAKGIASGFPAMVLAGRKEILSDPAVFAGTTQLPPRHVIPGQDFRAPGSSSSTFGGNPLAMSAINATLDEFERLDIGGHVRAVGNKLYEGFVAIAESCTAIGDVRGYGMMLGVELVSDRHLKTPAPELALDMYRICADNGLLIKIDDRGIVHVTPPLTHTAANAVEALDIFRDVLSYVMWRRQGEA